MSTVTKRELARQVAAQVACSTAQAQEAVDALFTRLREQLIEGHRIEIRGFGVLNVKHTKPNRGRATRAPANPSSSRPDARCSSSPESSSRKP